MSNMRYLGDCMVFCCALLLALPVVCWGNEDVVAVRIDFSDPIFSRLDGEGKNVLNEYAKVYPKIKKFYGNIRMDVAEKMYRPVTGKDSLTILEREESFEVRYNTRDGDTRGGGFARVDSQIQFLLVDDFALLGRIIQPKLNHTRQINLITPEAGYTLTKNKSDEPFYSLGAKRDHDAFMRTIGVKVLQFDTAPFSAGALLLENLFFKPPYFGKDAYFVTSARYTEDQDGQFVELESCIDRSSSTLRSSVWVVRLRRENWVVHDVFYQGWTAGGKYWHRYRCLYDGEFEGMPLLSSYQQDCGIYDTDGARKESLEQQIRYDVTQIIPGPPDLSEFDVAQFLPPDVHIGEGIAPATL